MTDEKHYWATQRVPDGYRLDVPDPNPVLEVRVDTREQDVPPFPRGVRLVPMTIETGDYTTPLLYGTGHIERKSPSDFVGTMTHDRERWDREVERAQDTLEWFCVVVEGSFDDCCGVSGQVHPNALLGSVSSLAAKGFPCSFVSTPAQCGYHIAGILRRWEARMAKLTPPPPIVHRLRDYAQIALARRSVIGYSPETLAARLAAYGG